MKYNSITVSAAASVANVSCGFDALGFSVEGPSDVVKITLTKKTGIVFKAITGVYGGLLSTDIHKNTASIPVQLFLQKIKYTGGVELELEKNLPLGSGMGSSAASAAAAIVGINKLFGTPFSVHELIPFAMEAERFACGAAHADNVAPAIMGGFVLVRSYDPLDVVHVPSPSALFCSIVHPNIELRTADARKILRKEILLSSAIVQWSNLAGLITGLITNDFALIGRSMQDTIIEPLRGILIPGYFEVKSAAIEVGVLGCGISGSGPSVFALSESQEIAKKAATAMQNAFDQNGIASQAYVSPINLNGPKIISLS